jgi:NAD(P)-dependent dehydrogenase (short-subunit alcohol dehydrogenase family)
MDGGSFLIDIFSLEGEVAVVTGASGFLGPVWIEGLLSAGANVFAIDHPKAEITGNLQKILNRFESDRVYLARADVRDRSALEKCCSRCLDIFDTPSVLVANAGIDSPPTGTGKGFDLQDIPFEVNREIFEVNTLGLFLTIQVFGGRMVEAGQGSIINIGSLYAGVSPDMRFYDHIQTDPPFLKPPAYGASKAAVVNLTKYLATLWASKGVRVNTLSPGGVLGGQDDEFKRKFCSRVPLGRMAVASDLCGPLLFLASKASSYVTGIELVVDGGFTAW